MGILRLLIAIITLMLICLAILPKTKKEQATKRQVLKTIIVICGILVVVFSIALYQLKDSLWQNSSYSHPLIQKIQSGAVGNKIFISKFDIRGINNDILKEALAKNKTINSIGFRNIAPDDIFVIASALSKNSNIIEADIKDLSKESSSEFATYISHYNLKKINLHSLSTSNLNIILKALGKYGKLTSLTLYDIKFNDKSAIYLKDIIASNKKIENLDLKFIGINDKQLIEMASAIKNSKHLYSLNLWGNKIADLGAKVLANNLIDNTSVNELYLGYNKITDKGVQHIANLIRNNSRIKVINLTQNKITDKSAYVIFEALKSNKSVEKVIVRSTKFTNDMRVLSRKLSEKQEQRLVIEH